MQVRAAEISSVYEEILVTKALSCCLRTTYISCHLHYRGLGMYVNHIIGNACSKHVLYSEFQRLGWPENAHVLAVVSQGEAYAWTGKRNSREFCDYVLELHIVRLEEFASCRNVIEQVPYTEVCASRSRNLLCCKVLRIGIIHLTSHLIFFPAGLECDFSYGCYRCESLASKAEGQDVVKVFCRLEFRCGMPFKTENRLIGRHSATIIDDLYQGSACVLNDYSDLISSGIDGILHQLLDHGCRSLHDLSRGYHVSYIAWKYPYIHRLLA